MSNIDEKLASIPTSPLLAERMTKEQPSRESDTEITRCSNDTISRQAAIDAVKDAVIKDEQQYVEDALKALPPVYVPDINVGDMISRQAAIEMLMNQNVIMDGSEYHNGFNAGVNRAQEVIRNLPTVQSDVPVINVGDMISRQAVIDALHMHLMYRMGTDSNKKRLDDWINGVPSVQLERTCVNCGRTVNNGGWYADGGTRCPIEEHYALPKDGYCHLWEKRNVTDDNYPERREE